MSEVATRDFVPGKTRCEMGLFGRSKGSRSQPFHRLEILMELGRGSWYQSGIPRQAAVRSTFIKPLPMEGADDLTGQLIASVLLCGRILVAHKDTREELASRLRTAAAEALLQKKSAPLSLAPWDLVTEASVYQLWPWPIVGPEQLREPVNYVAEVFVAEVQGQSLIVLDLAMGGRVRDTRVLAPSAAAIAVHTAANALAARDGSPLTLALLLYGLDDYFVREGYSVGGEAYALLHALQVIKQYAEGKGLGANRAAQPRGRLSPSASAPQSVPRATTPQPAMEFVLSLREALGREELRSLTDGPTRGMIDSNPGFLLVPLEYETLKKVLCPRCGGHSWDSVTHASLGPRNDLNWSHSIGGDYHECRCSGCGHVLTVSAHVL